MKKKECGTNLSWPDLRFYPAISLEGMRKSRKNPRQGSLSPLRDSNLGTARYEK
jgi:hypothetical protein